MKTLFQLYCLIRGMPWASSAVVWDVFRYREQTPWFKRFYGKSLFTADIRFMQYSSVFMDFLDDEGIHWTLLAFEAAYPKQEFHIGIWDFSMHFVTDIVKPFMLTADNKVVKEVSMADFHVVKGLFVRSLSRWLAKRNKMEEGHYVSYINQYLIT